MASLVASNCGSFFNCNFQAVSKEFVDKDVYQDKSEIELKFNTPKGRKLGAFVERLRKWNKNIRQNARKLKGGSDEDDSRPNSALSYNSSASGERSSPTLEVIDFIDDEYLSLRRRVRIFHRHLAKIYAHLDGALKRGPPLAGRLDALKTTFAANGVVGRFPEEAVAKSLERFRIDLLTDMEGKESNGKLTASLRDTSIAFATSAGLRQILVKEARVGFLAPLTEFLTKDWKEICIKDKALHDLAKKIQKNKIEGKLNQAEINALMSEFTVRRREVVENFDYILRSEIPLTKRLVNLMEAYKAYYFENTKIYNELERELRMRLGLEPPEKITFGELSSTSCMDAVTASQAEFSQVNLPGTVVSQEESGANETEEVLNARTTIPGLGDGDGSQALSSGSLTENVPTEKVSLWESRNLVPVKTPAYYRSTRAYGFCNQAFEASAEGDISLEVGDLVYMDSKLKDEKTEEIWICGEVAGARPRAGLFPMSIVQIIIDID